MKNKKNQKQNKKGLKSFVSILLSVVFLFGLGFLVYDNVPGVKDVVNEIITPGPTTPDDEGTTPTTRPEDIIPDNEEFVYVVINKTNGEDLILLTLEPGTILNEPQAPQREKHLFDKWVSSVSFNWGAEVTQNMVITAEWLRLYTVSFNFQIIERVETFTFLRNEVVDFTPVVQGRVFIGWTRNNTLLVGTIKVLEDMALVASWEPLTVDPVDPIEPEPIYYTLTINLNNGSAAQTIQVLEGESFGEPAQPTRPGYNFLGWQTSGYMFGTPVVSNLTIIATWQQIVEPMPEITLIADALAYRTITVKAVVTKIYKLSDENKFFISIQDSSGAVSTPSGIVDSFLNTVVSGDEIIYTCRTSNNKSLISFANGPKEVLKRNQAYSVVEILSFNDINETFMSQVFEFTMFTRYDYDYSSDPNGSIMITGPIGPSNIAGPTVTINLYGAAQANLSVEELLLKVIKVKAVLIGLGTTSATFYVFDEVEFIN